MDQQQIRTLAGQFIDALHTLEQGDVDQVDTIVAMFSDDARLTNAALSLVGEERQGSQGVGEFWIEYRRTFGSVYSEFHHVTTDEGAAGLFWTTKGTDTDGETLAYDGVSLLEFNDAGKISFFRGYYDTRQISRKVGVG